MQRLFRLFYVTIFATGRPLSRERNGVIIVKSPAFSIHADLNVSSFETLQIAGTGEVASLITVPDAGNGELQGPIHAVEDKRHLQGMVSSQQTT